MKQFTIQKNDSGQRLNKFLEKAVPHLPGGLMHKYIRIKRIKVNGKRTDFAYRLQEGDVLQLYINDEFFEAPKKRSETEAYLHVKPNISVIYEDDHILLVNKPAGLVVHADDNGTTDTLIARIQAYLFQYGRWNPDAEASFTPSLCNRIDRGTSGIVIAAKTAEALRVMNQKIRDREIHKSYLCVTCGHVRPKDGRIQNYILRHEAEHRVTVHDRPVPGARTAITQYHVLKETPELSLVECDLITGRTHQLRVHCAHHLGLGNPIVGDRLYGTPAVRLMLHAARLAFDSYAFEDDLQGFLMKNGDKFALLA